MRTVRVSFVRISIGTNHIYGLDADGNVWYRATAPYTYSTTTYPSYDKDKKEDWTKELWKPISMLARIEIPEPETKEIKKIDEILDRDGNGIDEVDIENRD